MKITMIFLIFFTSFSSVLIAEDTFNFDWRSDKAIVTETMNKNGAEVIVEYKVQLKRTDEGLHFIQNSSEAKFANGQKLERKAVKSMLGAMFMMPEMLFNQKGELIRVLNPEDFLEKFAKESGSPNSTELKNSEMMQAMLFAKYYEKWCYWVCNWTEFDLNNNSVIEDNSDMKIFGTVLPANVVIKNHGMENGFAKLTYVEVIGMPNVKKVLDELSNEFGWNKNSKQADDIEDAAASKITKVKALMQVNTMKPYKVDVEIISSGRHNGETTSKVVSHVFEFEWVK